MRPRSIQILRRLVRPALVASVVGLAVAWHLGSRTPDFTVLYAAARNADGRVYDHAYLTAFQGLNYPAPWAYPPTFLLMVLPLSLLSFKAAYVLWVSLSSATYVEATSLLTGRWAPLIILSPLFFVFVAMGQTSLLVASLAVAGIALLSSKPILAGVLLGVAGCIKPQTMMFVVPALMVGRHWTTLFSAGATGAALCIVATFAFGPNIWIDWLGSLPEFLAINQRMGISGIGPSPLFLKVALLLIGILLVGRTFRTGDAAVQIITLFGAALLCSPHSVRYDLVVLAPAALALVLRREWSGMVAAIFLTGLLTSWPGLLLLMISSQLPAREQTDDAAKRAIGLN